MNLYRDEAGCYYEYDDVHAKDYVWMSYQFLYGTINEYGSTSYDNIFGMNTYTFIHEFGHVLGLSDYYDYTGLNTPLLGLDMMCATVSDHNAYSKINLGWITASRLVVTDSSVTLTLEDFSKNGDTIIIANNWDDKLGAYQEYYILVYQTTDGLNSGEGFELMISFSR
jgi:M6 family metalloprotease-like protein